MSSFLKYNKQIVIKYNSVICATFLSLLTNSLAFKFAFLNGYTKLEFYVFSWIALFLITEACTLIAKAVYIPGSYEKHLTNSDNRDDYIKYTTVLRSFYIHKNDRSRYDFAIKYLSTFTMFFGYFGLLVLFLIRENGLEELKLNIIKLTATVVFFTIYTTIVIKADNE